MHYLSQHLIPKILTPEHNQTRMTLAGASTIFYAVVTSRHFPVSATKKWSERQ
jgi:hypothetical protein